MQVFPMEVSKTVAVKGGKNYREKVGTVEVTVPILKDIISIVAEAEIDTEAMDTARKEAIKAKEVFDELPIYKDGRADWVFGAMLAAVKAGARNKLQAGSVELKSSDTPIPLDWDGIIASGEGRGGAAAFALLKEVKALWATFVGKLGKSEATSQVLITYFNNKQALLSQSDENRAKMLKYVEDFAGELSEEDAEKYQKPLDAVLSACAEGIAAGSDF